MATTAVTESLFSPLNLSQPFVSYYDIENGILLNDDSLRRANTEKRETALIKNTHNSEPDSYNDYSGRDDKRNNREIYYVDDNNTPLDSGASTISKPKMTHKPNCKSKSSRKLFEIGNLQEDIRGSDPYLFRTINEFKKKRHSYEIPPPPSKFILKSSLIKVSSQGDMYKQRVRVLTHSNKSTQNNNDKHPESGHKWAAYNGVSLTNGSGHSTNGARPIKTISPQVRQKLLEFLTNKKQQLNTNACFSSSIPSIKTQFGNEKCENYVIKDPANSSNRSQSFSKAVKQYTNDKFTRFLNSNAHRGRDEVSGDDDDYKNCLNRKWSSAFALQNRLKLKCPNLADTLNTGHDQTSCQNDEDSDRNHTSNQENKRYPSVIQSGHRNSILNLRSNILTTKCNSHSSVSKIIYKNPEIVCPAGGEYDDHHDFFQPHVIDENMIKLHYKRVLLERYINKCPKDDGEAMDEGEGGNYLRKTYSEPYLKSTIRSSDFQSHLNTCESPKNSQSPLDNEIERRNNYNKEEEIVDIGNKCRYFANKSDQYQDNQYPRISYFTPNNNNPLMKPDLFDDQSLNIRNKKRNVNFDAALWCASQNIAAPRFPVSNLPLASNFFSSFPPPFMMGCPPYFLDPQLILPSQYSFLVERNKFERDIIKKNLEKADKDLVSDKTPHIDSDSGEITEKQRLKKAIINWVANHKNKEIQHGNDVSENESILPTAELCNKRLKIDSSKHHYCQQTSLQTKSPSLPILSRDFRNRTPNCHSHNPRSYHKFLRSFENSPNSEKIKHQHSIVEIEAGSALASLSNIHADSKKMENI
ncbi:unnamed protein product [Gordionus sp. m RMFG-2023]|uniref:uncharacterized protein LOC135927373 isoform X2 n=1 Tax=Gordionus sp. m RMFG-2023 TaxID=3053472 RepID=UPI0030DF0DF6